MDNGAGSVRRTDGRPFPLTAAQAALKSETPRGPFGCRGALSVRLRVPRGSDERGSHCPYTPMDAQVQDTIRLPPPEKPPSSESLLPEQIAAIRATISSSRFATYLKA